MNLKKAYELLSQIKREIIEMERGMACYNPGLSSKEKPDLSSLNLDAATVQSRLSLFRSILSEEICLPT